MTADAYLLFYQKSSLSTTSPESKVNPSTSSISSGYLSSVTCSSNFNLHHWSFQMPPFNYYNNGNSNNSKSSTLPNRREVQNRLVAANGPSQAHRGNQSSRSPNYEATKHSSNGNSSFYVHQNGGKMYEPGVSSQRSSNSSNHSNYSNNNTFPRIKSRQASH